MSSRERPPHFQGTPVQKNPSVGRHPVNREEQYAPPTTAIQELPMAAPQITGLAGPSTEQLLSAPPVNLSLSGCSDQGNDFGSWSRMVSTAAMPSTVDAALTETTKRNNEASDPPLDRNTQAFLRSIEANQNSPAAVQAMTVQNDIDHMKVQLQLARQIRLARLSAAPEQFASSNHASESIEVAQWAERRCERFLLFLERESKDLQNFDITAFAGKNASVEAAQRARDSVIQPIIDSGSDPRVCLERLEIALWTFLNDHRKLTNQVRSLYEVAIRKQKVRVAQLEKEAQQGRRGETAGKAVRAVGKGGRPAQREDVSGSDARRGIHVSNQVPRSVSGDDGAAEGSLPLHTANSRTEHRTLLTSGPRGDGQLPSDIDESHGGDGKAGWQSAEKEEITSGALEPGVKGIPVRKRKDRTAESAVSQGGHDAVKDLQTTSPQGRDRRPRFERGYSSREEISPEFGARGSLASSSQNPRLPGPVSKSTSTGLAGPRAGALDVGGAVAGLDQGLQLRSRQVDGGAASSDEAARNLPSVQLGRSEPAADPGLGRSSPVRDRYAAGEGGLESGAGSGAGGGPLPRLSVLGATAQAIPAGVSRGPQLSEANTGGIVAAGNIGADEGRKPRGRGTEDPAATAAVAVAGTFQAHLSHLDTRRREAHRHAQNTYLRRKFYNSFLARIVSVEKILAAKLTEQANAKQPSSATSQDRQLLDRDIARLDKELQKIHVEQEEARKELESAVARQNRHRNGSSSS